MVYNEEIITSRQNQMVTATAKLADRKWREADGLFRCDGVKLFGEAVLRGVEVAWVLLRASDREKVLEKTAALFGDTVTFSGIRVLTLADNVFDKLTDEKSPEGIITVGKYIDKFHKIVTIDNNCLFEGKGFYLLLESVRDPVNVGTMIRTAAAMGVTGVIMSRDCADLYHPKTLRAAMGTVFNLPVTVCESLTEAATALRADGHRVYAAALDENAQPLHNLTPCPGDCIVIGNEGHGLSSELIVAATAPVYIPMQANVESLNAAAAAAVLLWHFGASYR